MDGINKKTEYQMVIKTDCSDINYTYRVIRFGENALNNALMAKEAIWNSFHDSDLSRSPILIIDEVPKSDFDDIAEFLSKIDCPNSKDWFYAYPKDMYGRLFSEGAFGNDVPYSLESVTISKVISEVDVYDKEGNLIHK